MTRRVWVLGAATAVFAIHCESRDKLDPDCSLFTRTLKAQTQVSGTSWPYRGYTCLAATSGDFNGDGQSDLAVALGHDKEVRIFVSLGFPQKTKVLPVDTLKEYEGKPQFSVLPAGHYESVGPSARDPERDVAEVYSRFNGFVLMNERRPRRLAYFLGDHGWIRLRLSPTDS